MDPTQILKDSFNQLIKDVLPYVVGAFIMALLTAFTLGILAGPMMAGYTRMILLRLRENRTPKIGDVFYFENFITYMLSFYVLVIAVGIGFALFVIPGLYLVTIWFFVTAIMVDKSVGLGEAMSRARSWSTESA